MGLTMKVSIMACLAKKHFYAEFEICTMYRNQVIFQSLNIFIERIWELWGLIFLRTFAFYGPKTQFGSKIPPTFCLILGTVHAA